MLALESVYCGRIALSTPLMKSNIRLENKLSQAVMVRSFNRLSNNCDQLQISPCNMNAYSTCGVMRIKDMITLGEFS